MARVRVARWHYLTARLREIEPRNRFFESLREPGHVPTEDDLREAEEALNEARRRLNPSAAPTTVQPLGAEPLFTRPPGGSPYDLILEFRKADDLANYMRQRGASEPEIAAAVERFQREQEPASGSNDPTLTGRPPSRENNRQSGLPGGFPDQNTFREFGSEIRSYFANLGYDDVEPILQGSAVTGIRQTGLPFDVGEDPSDLDVALVSSELLNRARELRFPLRSRGTRTGPLQDDDLEKLGLTELARELTNKAGRDVHLMIFGSSADAILRGPSLRFGD